MAFSLSDHGPPSLQVFQWGNNEAGGVSAANSIVSPLTFLDSYDGVTFTAGKLTPRQWRKDDEESVKAEKAQSLTSHNCPSRQGRHSVVGLTTVFVQQRGSIFLGSMCGRRKRGPACIHSVAGGCGCPK